MGTILSYVYRLAGFAGNSLTQVKEKGKVSGKWKKSVERVEGRIQIGILSLILNFSVPSVISVMEMP